MKMSRDDTFRHLIRSELARLLQDDVFRIRSEFGHLLKDQPVVKRAPKAQPAPANGSKVLAYLRGKPALPVSAIATALRMPKKKAAKELLTLREEGVVRMSGQRRGAKWVAR
jgi:hypothetical protein